MCIRDRGLGEFLAAQPPATAAWLTATGFQAGAGEVRLIPGASGEVAGAVAGLGNAKAVSYTHLDVYKRQLQHVTVRLLRHRRLRQEQGNGKRHCHRKS